MGRTEQLGNREREKDNGKDCEEESEARPQGEDEAHCRQALGRRPPQVGEARCASSGRAEGQGSPSGSLNFTSFLECSAG
jgi:hypothetical protein